MVQKVLMIILAVLLLLMLSLKATNAEMEDQNAILLAKIVYTEARGVDSKMEQAAVIWCVLNRVDAWGGTIKDVVTEPAQFAWNNKAPCQIEFYNLARDVLLRWELEKIGVSTSTGRVLPKEYLYFTARGNRNIFRTEHSDGYYWDWDCNNPYETK